MQVRRRRYDRTVLAPGQDLRGQDSYEVGDVIGEGGYAVVYAGTARGGASVALKEFLRGSTVIEHGQIRDLFERERRVLWTLRFHPHLPDLIEAFSQDGMHYLVLEYVPGESLRERLERAGPVAPAEAPSLSLQLARAVAALHGEGVVHHDVKPDNVKFRASGLVVLLDLGSARSAGLPSEGLHPIGHGPDGAAVGAGLATQIVGTPGYMAPELHDMVESDSVRSDYRLDVFALGCTICEMVTGRRLQQSDIDARKAEEVRSALEEAGDLCPELAAPLTMAMELEEERRQASAQDLLEDLERVVPPRAATCRELLRFQAARGEREREELLVITNAGGGRLSGRIRSPDPRISFLRPGGGRTADLPFEGNATAVRVVAAMDAGPFSGALEIEAAEETIPVRCEVVSKAPEPMRLTVRPASLTLIVTRETTQQAIVRVTKLGGAPDVVRARVVQGPAVVEVVPASMQLRPAEEGQFRLLPVRSGLRPGVHRTNVVFTAESGETTDPVRITVDARTGLGRYLRLGH